MMNKSYFLIIYNRKHEILVLNKKSLSRWEIPRVSSSKEVPIYKLAEDYMATNFDVKFKIVGKSNIVDKYEWPKELVNITGKSGEEHLFIFIRLESHFNNSCIKENTDIKGYDILDYSGACERVIFKNHRKVLWNVLEDLKKKEQTIPSSDKIYSEDEIENNKEDSIDGLNSNLVDKVDDKTDDEEFDEDFIEPERYR